MKLRNIEFGPVLGASGIQGFFGEGYPYHTLLRRVVPGFTFKGITFVAKTTTVHPRLGNMPLKKNGITPKELFPKCIIVKPFKKVALNAVGLSGPGSNALFDSRLWQERTGAFFISFMSIEDTPEKRRHELRLFVDALKANLLYFKSKKVGLQLNFSCPNTGHKQEELVGEIWEALTIASVLNIPLMPKLSVMISPEDVIEIQKHKACDGFCISNTIPWGQLPHEIDWKGLFGSDISPLSHLGGGGLSGKPLLVPVASWLNKALALGLSKPVSVGGGILKADDLYVIPFKKNWSVSLGSIVMLSPWNMKSVIRRAYEILA